MMTYTPRISVINILAGVMWEWEIDDDEIPNLERIIDTTLRAKYKWHEFEVEALKKGLDDMICEARK